MLPCEIWYASKSPDIIVLPLGVQVIIVGNNRKFRQLCRHSGTPGVKVAVLKGKIRTVEIPRIEEVDKEGKATGLRQVLC